jgi:hypothetical protein
MILLESQKDYVALIVPGIVRIGASKGRKTVVT